MNIQVIHEHSFDTSLLGAGSNVLDVGCMGFEVSTALVKMGCRVVAMDPNPDIQPPDVPGLTFLNKALVKPGVATSQSYCMLSDTSANHLAVTHRPHCGRTETVECLDILAVTYQFKVPVWDAVKLDCEGAEYDILATWPGPIAKQISVEFHEHVGANPYGERFYATLQSGLSQWYTFVQHEKSLRFGSPVPNYWDSLLVLKALA